MNSVSILERRVNAMKSPTSAKVTAIVELLTFTQALADEIADEGHGEGCDCDFCLDHDGSPNSLKMECTSLSWTLDAIRSNFGMNLAESASYYSDGNPTALVQLATAIRKARKMEKK